MNRRKFLNGVVGQTVGLTVMQATLGCSQEPAHQSKGSTNPATTNNTDTNVSTRGLPANISKIEIVGDRRVITTNSLPNHRVGSFPNMDCPCIIKPVNKTYFMPANPQIASQITPLNGWLMGVSIKGVAFDPTGPFWDPSENNLWQFEVMSEIARPYLGLDGSSAHVQPSGEYHYHGIPHDLISALEFQEAGKKMLLLGFAADGFPIYAPIAPSDPLQLSSPLMTIHSSYKLKEGQRPNGGPLGFYDGTFVQDYEYKQNAGTLDECNGRFGVTPEFPEGIYHYFVTSTFPFISRYYRGTPDSSFAHGLPGPSAVPPALKKYGRTTAG